ncbi:MAG: hypothetical protein K6G91_14365 [Kiritimatiellae bacterium]|nr:hypothetical protein [Kiritimatiellia bacterium]
MERSDIQSGLTSMPIKREPAFWRPDGCITEAIMAARIQRVKELLLNRGIPIDSIFCECG